MSRNHTDVIEQLVREHSARLVLYARQWTSDPDDVVQEALTRLAGCRRMPDECVSWLYRVVRNLAINSGRSNRRRQIRETTWASGRSDWFELDTNSPIDATVAAEALMNVSHDVREIVILKLWCDKTYEEIAELVNSSPSTAFRRYAEGLAELKKQLLRISEPNPRQEH